MKYLVIIIFTPIIKYLPISHLLKRLNVVGNGAMIDYWKSEKLAVLFYLVLLHIYVKLDIELQVKK